MTKITEVEGIGPSYAEKLTEAGCSTQEQLLNDCGDPKGRKTLAEKCGISEKLVLKWTNRADLARIKGIGSEYADLLEFSGVDTVPELAQRNAKNLHNKMQEINTEKSLVRAVPSASQVEDWVGQAKKLPRAISY